jgi:hypothetical protein
MTEGRAQARPSSDYDGRAAPPSPVLSPRSFPWNRPASADARHHSAFIEETSDSVLAVGNWSLAANPRLSFSEYLSLFVRKYRRKYLQLCRGPCPWLNPALCLDPCLNLYFNLNPSLCGWLFRTLLEKLFRQLFAALCGSLFELMYG